MSMRLRKFFYKFDIFHCIYATATIYYTQGDITMNISDYIRKRRLELGLTMKKLSEKVGVSEGTVSRWESGKIVSMRQDKLSDLAEALQTTPSYLMGWTDDPYDYDTDPDDRLGSLSGPMWEKALEDNDHDEAAAYQDYMTGQALVTREAQAEYAPKPTVKIPVIGMVHAGTPTDAIEDILGWEEVTNDMAAKGDLMALQVKGDCMEPRFTEGDVVMVLQQPSVNSGDIAILMVNADEAIMRQVKLFEDGSLNLIPTNPTYQVKRFSPEEIKSLPVRILGKVIELRAKF